LLEQIVHLVLRHILGKVTNNNVGFLIEISGVCLVQNNGPSSNDSVIHLLLALVSLFVRVESQVSIVLLVCLTLVSLDHGTLYLITLRSKKLVQVQVVVIGGEISHVETWLILSFTVVSLLVAAVVAWLLLVADLHEC